MTVELRAPVGVTDHAPIGHLDALGDTRAPGGELEKGHVERAPRVDARLPRVSGDVLDGHEARFAHGDDRSERAEGRPETTGREEDRPIEQLPGVMELV